MHSLQEIYDGFADTYEHNRGLFDMSSIIHSFNAKLNPTPEKALLDLGCGAGEPFARFFIEQGWQATGIDFSRRMLELAAIYVPQMKRIHSDICKADFDAESFDAITAIYCLFHISHKDHPALFKNIYRWLKSGGKALFTYATRDYTGYDEFEGYKTFMGQELFYSHTTPQKLESILVDTGLNIEAMDNHEIGGETFLWVTVEKKAS